MNVYNIFLYYYYSTSSTKGNGAVENKYKYRNLIFSLYELQRITWKNACQIHTI